MILRFRRSQLFIIRYLYIHKHCGHLSKDKSSANLYTAGLMAVWRQVKRRPQLR